MRYRVLSKLLKAILTIVHGNADVERSLSENKNVLTKERSLMTDASLNAIRMTKDAVRVIGSGSVEKMPITSGLIRARDLAHATYKKRMAEEKAKMEKESRKRLQQEKDT